MVTDIDMFMEANMETKLLGNRGQKYRTRYLERIPPDHHLHQASLAIKYIRHNVIIM